MTGSDWSDTHPGELQLAAFADGGLASAQREDVEAHVARCLRCRRRLIGLLPSFDVGEPHLPEHAGGVAAVVLEALAEPSGGEPQPDELWRAVGPDEAMLVWVVRTFDDAVRVIPCSFDVELADEYTIVLDASETPLGLPLALHTTIETELPPEVFNARIATLSLNDNVERVRATRQQGRPAPADIKVGPPIVDPLDERVAFRDTLAGVAGKIGAAAVEELAEEEQDPPPFLDDEASADSAVSIGLGPDVTGELASCRPHAQTDTENWPALSTPFGPLQPVFTVQELAVRIVACVLPVADPALLDEEPIVRAAGKLLRSRNDVACVALVAADPDQTTRVRDVYDTAEEVVIAPQGAHRRPLPSRPALPFVQAVCAAFEELLPNFEALDEGLLRPAEIDFRALAIQATEEAVRSIRAAAGRAKIEGKQGGYRSVGLADQTRIVQLVELARTGEVDQLQDRIDELARRAS
jgi:hypothetical protein